MTHNMMIHNVLTGNKNRKRLTLIASDPRISAALMILSVTKMILIYLNYRLWSVKLKDIYGEVLDTLVFDRNLDVFDMYRLFLFL